MVCVSCKPNAEEGSRGRDLASTHVSLCGMLVPVLPCFFVILVLLQLHHGHIGTIRSAESRVFASACGMSRPQAPTNMDQVSKVRCSAREQSTRWEKRACLHPAWLQQAVKHIKPLGEHWCSCLLHTSLVTVCSLSPTTSGHRGWKLLLLPKEEQFGYSAMGNKILTEMVDFLLSEGHR